MLPGLRNIYALYFHHSQPYVRDISCFYFRGVPRHCKPSLRQTGSLYICGNVEASIASLSGIVVSARHVYSVYSHAGLCLSPVMGKNFCAFFFGTISIPSTPKDLGVPHVLLIPRAWGI